MSVAWKLSPTANPPRYPKRWYLSNVTTGLRGEHLDRARSRMQRSSSQIAPATEAGKPSTEAGKPSTEAGKPSTQPLTLESAASSGEVLVWSSGMAIPNGQDVFAGKLNSSAQETSPQVLPITSSTVESNQLIVSTPIPVYPQVTEQSAAQPVEQSLGQTTDRSASSSAHHSVEPSAAQSTITTSPELVDVTTLSPAVARAFERRQQEWAKKGVLSKSSHGFSVRSLLRYSMVGIMILSLVVMASVVVPDIYYRLNPESASDVIQVSPEGLENQVAVVEPVAPTPAPTPEPPIDVTLPEGSWLMIPSIGVNTQLVASEDPNEALSGGAWLVPDFGRPNDSSLPIIAAAHRFGWDWWWQSDFGRKNSFYSLPNLEAGDTVEIVYNQRKYIYSVYAIEEGQAIEDYTADLILYTCKYFNSPERYFTYANRDYAAEAAFDNTLVNEASEQSAEIATSFE